MFSLIGPKKYDVPWRELETKGWIAAATCTEIRVALPDDKTRMEYAVAEQRGEVPHRQREPGEGRRGRPSCSTATTTSACSSSAST